MSVQRATFKDFSGGMVTEAPPTDLAPNQLRYAHNVNVRNAGAVSQYGYSTRTASFLQLITGQRQVLALPSMNVTGFTKFRPGAGGTPFLVYGLMSYVYAYVEGGTTSQTIVTPITNYAVDHMYAVMYDRVFIVNGLPSGFGDDAVMKAWDGVAATATDVGEPVPNGNFNLSYTLDNNASLYTDGEDVLVYFVTYQNARGVESNPLEIGIVGVYVANQHFSVTIAKGSGFPAPPADVTQINFYRRGGGLSIPFFVGSMAPSSSSFTDNTANGNLIDRTLSYSHDVPPTGCGLVMAWGNRLALANTNIGRVYVSTLGQPDYFPATVTDESVDGQYFDVDPEAENPIVAMGGVGSALLIARRRNIYILEGQNVNNFTFKKVADIGCVAKRSLVQCGDMAVWLAPDGQVWSLGDQPACLTHDSISRTLEAVPMAYRQRACACYFNHQYHLCIPNNIITTTTQAGTQATAYSTVGVYMVYDFRTSAWTDYTDLVTNATQLYCDTGLSDQGEVYASRPYLGAVAQGAPFQPGLFAMLGPWTTPGYSYTDAGAPAGAVAYNHPVAFDVWGGDLEMENMDALKKVRGVTVRGRLAGNIPATGTGVPMLTLYARSDTDTDGQAVSQQFPLAATNATTTTDSTGATVVVAGDIGTLLSTRVPSSMAGQRLSWRVTGAACIFELHSVELDYAVVRTRPY